MLGLVSAVVAGPSSGRGITLAHQIPQSSLVFDDLNRFEALARTPSISDWVARYLSGASAGLAAYMKTYNLTATDFERAIAERPTFYRGLVGLRDRIKPQDRLVLRAMQRVRELAPRTPVVPVYFFVGTFGPGATVKEVTPQGGEGALGILIPSEMVAITPATDMSEFPEGRCGRGGASALPQLVAHEYTHVAQVQLQGLERYRSIYRPGPNTNIAYAVREGTADFLSWLASGQLRERHRYLLANEASLWPEFEAVLNQPVSNSSGWFSTPQGPRCERPVQLGYALGWAICKRYYESAQNKRRALEVLLSAVEPSDFEAIIKPYRTGSTPSQDKIPM